MRTSASASALLLAASALAAVACTSTGEVLGPGGSVVLRASDVRLASGWGHSCAVAAGALTCWGDDADGRLGVPAGGGAGQGPVTVAVPTGGGWLVPAAGERHSCALTTAGAVFCWGANDQGQLATGDRNPQSAPSPVALPADAVDVRTGFGHTCALLADASLWCWGDNLEGQLGLGDVYPGDDRLTPVQIGSDDDWTAVSTGQGHTCGIRAPGRIYCWGRNTDAELGQGSAQPEEIRAPVAVDADEDWIDVACGQSYTCARKRDRSLWCWGASASGALGVGDVDPRPTPARVPVGSDWLTLSANTFHTCGVRASGEVWCAGRDTEGQLGSSDFADADPDMQRVDAGTTFVEVRAGRFFTCARKADDTVWCLGDNGSWQLGVDPAATPRTSTLVQAR
jgi:alpha-tubulin suppressor-like RCC1 family protein